jgi:mannose-binding lectin 1
MKLRTDVVLGLVLAFLGRDTVDLQDIPSRKFEYKFSFKGPYLSQKDGSVPFWQYSGNAIASDESVRITPSLRSQKGQMWTKHKTDFDWYILQCDYWTFHECSHSNFGNVCVYEIVCFNCRWEVELVFRVTGRGRIGADGLAFWFTENRGREGPVFGSSDQWNGLGIFFDSFDNDNKHNNPYIMGVLNDGTKIFDHQNDGSTQQLAGCLRDYRNKPYPVTMNYLSIIMKYHFISSRVY